MRISTLLNTVDMSQQDLADLVGISRVSMGKLIKSDTADRLVAAIHMLHTLHARGSLPRGYHRTDAENRQALVKKLREVLDASISN